MRIGTVRPEEARIFDSHAGFHQFHSEETQEPYGSFEIFWGDKAKDDDGELIWPNGEGWYWWACHPGCMPDGEVSGPFASSRQALEDADEWNPEFDDADTDAD